MTTTEVKRGVGRTYYGGYEGYSYENRNRV
jgi:hypothetical protein